MTRLKVKLDTCHKCGIVFSRQEDGMIKEKKPRNKMSRLSVDLGPAHHKTLKQLAANRGITIKEMTIIALDALIKMEGFSAEKKLRAEEYLNKLQEQ